MFEDRGGLRLSTTSERAAEQYRLGVDAFLSASAGVEEAFESALAADPDFALGHAARARGLQARGVVPAAKEAIGRARALAAGVTPRERRHIEALSLAIDGDLTGGLALVREHLADTPRDALVLSLVTGVYSLVGASGRRDRDKLLRDLLDGVASAYVDDWWFLGMHGFACTESGSPAEGRRKIERSLALRPRNANAAHALAHVFYEEGDSLGGADFVNGWIPGYERTAQLHCHLSWHLSLFELGAGRGARALAVYEDSIRPGVARSAATGAVADSSAFLWRCQLWGVGPPALPWSEIRDFATRSFPRPSTAFAEAHIVMALAAAGDRAAVESRLAELRRMEREGRQPAGPVVADVAQGMAAYAWGDYAEAIRLIQPVFEEIVRVGGSRAQRDVFEQTLLSSYLRAGRVEDAEELFRQRLEGRPAVPGHLSPSSPSRRERG
jgi:pentatricopeptide repeat protein